MTWEPSVRNYDGIQFEELRRTLDPEFDTLHDNLSSCYYNFWKFGNSKPFVVNAKSWDVQNTPAESKVLFDKLHGLVFHMRDVKFHSENMKRPKPKQYDENKYRYIRNELGEITKDRLQVSLDKIAIKMETKIEHLKIIQDVISRMARNWLKRLNSYE